MSGDNINWLDEISKTMKTLQDAKALNKASTPYILCHPNNKEEIMQVLNQAGIRAVVTKEPLMDADKILILPNGDMLDPLGALR